MMRRLFCALALAVAGCAAQPDPPATAGGMPALPHRAAPAVRAAHPDAGELDQELGAIQDRLRALQSRIEPVEAKPDGE